MVIAPSPALMRGRASPPGIVPSSLSLAWGSGTPVPLPQHFSTWDTIRLKWFPPIATCYRSAMTERPTRADAEALLFEFTKSDALRKHARAVEAAMRAYAGWFGITDPETLERWGIVGLLHD